MSTQPRHTCAGATWLASYSLQGLTDEFDFGPQRDALTYKQLGNGVNTGVVWNVLKAHVARDAHLSRPPIVEG